MFKNRKVFLWLTISLAVFMTFAVGYGKKPKIVFVDTCSGANYQEYFTQRVIPNAVKKLGFDIDYIVSSGPEMTERMKAWGKTGDFHILMVKQDDLGAMFQEKIPLVKLYPDLISKVPNLTKISKTNLAVSDEVNLNGYAALFWRSIQAIIYDSAKIPNPPPSWKELYNRRAEFKGHIGVCRPDAKSSGGRRFMYGFLHAFGVDFKKPFAQLVKTTEWQDAWAKWEDFSTYLYKPLATEPPVLFQQFKSGDVWISEYSLDYTLWSRERGLLPKSLKGRFFAEGDTAGSDALIIVPQKIGRPEKAAALKLVNYLLSDEVQVDMITTMWNYTGTDIDNKIPASVWDNIPKWEVALKSKIKLENADALKYITQEGMSHMK